MTKPRSETKEISDFFGGHHHETRIVDKEGNVYDSAGITPEESQKRASEKYEKGEPTWKPG